MSSTALSLFYRQCATMLNAGVPVYQALTTLQEQRQPPQFRNCLQALSASVLAGHSLSLAMAAFPQYFTPFPLAMVTAGEKSGDLVLAMQRVAGYLEEEHMQRSQIRRELFYPKVVMTFVLLFWPVVLYGLQSSPVAFVLVGIAPLLLFGLLLLTGAITPRLSRQSSPWVDQLILRLPVLGKTASLIAQTQFARNLSFLYHAGISLPEAVRWAGDACGNACLATPLRLSAKRLDAGEGLASALSASGVLDPILVTMLKTGELTGNLENTLDKAAEHFQMMTSVSMHQLKTSLGVASLLSAGLCVGIILVRFYA